MALRRIKIPDTIPGSLPSANDLARILGPVANDNLIETLSLNGPDLRTAAEFVFMDDFHLDVMLLTLVWVKRGRNDLLESGETFR